MSKRRDRSVSYKELDVAIAKAEELFPGADDYRPMLHMNEILVEVWKDGHAKVHRIKT